MPDNQRLDFAESADFARVQMPPRRNARPHLAVHVLHYEFIPRPHSNHQTSLKRGIVIASSDNLTHLDLVAIQTKNKSSHTGCFDTTL